jgi:hypothetical protein
MPEERNINVVRVGTCTRSDMREMSLSYVQAYSLPLIYSDYALFTASMIQMVAQVPLSCS